LASGPGSPTGDRRDYDHNWEFWKKITYKNNCFFIIKLIFQKKKKSLKWNL
jgi:hypothetical protein